ncbi:MAG: UPF0280 family protein [Promethearchaeota archaeon]
MVKKYKVHITEKESDVTIISESFEAIERAKTSFYFHRKILEEYIVKNEQFYKSFSPLDIRTGKEIIDLMIKGSKQCKVGPMATVAGALADLMMREMKREDKDYPPARIALIENGGEIVIDSEEDFKIGLYAGKNPLNLEIGFLIKKDETPIGIGTSSATVGHAISLGEADAVTIFAPNATLADGAATYIANLVKGKDIEKSIKKGLDAVDDIEGIIGAFISRENKVGHIGKIPEMFRISGNHNKLLKGKVGEVIPHNYEIFD